jgi:hypothetical protein
MTEYLRVRQGRRFKPRIPKEELDARVRERFTECGAPNNLQAQYEASAARVAQSLTDPMFFAVKANLNLDRRSPAWKGAYTVLFAYLDEFRMGSTRDSIDAEAAGGVFPEDDAVLGSARGSDFLAGLVRLAIGLGAIPGRFAEAVQEYAVASDAAAAAPAKPPPKTPPRVQERPLSDDFDADVDELLERGAADRPLLRPPAKRVLTPVVQNSGSDGLERFSEDDEPIVVQAGSDVEEDVVDVDGDDFDD